MLAAHDFLSPSATIFPTPNTGVSLLPTPGASPNSQISKRQISRRPLPTCRLHAAAAAAPISGSVDRRPPSLPRARAVPSRPAGCKQRSQGQSRHLRRPAPRGPRPQSSTADGPTATCQAPPPPPSTGSLTSNRRPAVRPGPGRAACGPTAQAPNPGISDQPQQPAEKGRRRTKEVKNR